jgi:hypothetical protein
MKSRVIFFRKGQEINKGRWDGRANAKTAPINVNWDYRHIDFDMAECKTEGGKFIIVKKEIPVEDKTDEENSLDQLFETFNKKIEGQFKDILAKIDAINNKLRDA